MHIILVHASLSRVEIYSTQPARFIDLHRLQKRRVHVHHDRLDTRDLFLKNLRKALASAIGSISVGDRLDHAAVQLVAQCDAAPCFANRFLVDVNSEITLFVLRAFLPATAFFKTRQISPHLVRKIPWAILAVWGI